MRPHASKQDFKVALAGLQFPTSKAAVLNRARDHGGLDHEVKVIIERLPDRAYQSAEELEAALRAIYLAQGVPQEVLPV